ncbi:MAG: amino acid adenylation domain-containing protein, partial [bacterium]|nr:amino acid adenylation domain-containing protein [bacterium]
TDGISMEIIAKELWQLYDGEELSPLRLQYKDFSQWLNNDNRMAAVKEQEVFWLKEFSGEIPLINLPTDFSRPGKLTFEGDTFQFEIGKQETVPLNKIARDYAESLYMVLFAAFNVLLAKISGQEDVVVGTVTAGRGHADLENIVGMFLNTLALRNYPEGKKSFEDFLSDVKLTTFAAFEHQDYPFDKLVKQVAPREEVGRNPLFDVAFGLENEADPTGYLMEVAVPDKAKPYDFETRKAKFDMTLVCIEIEDGLECMIEYKTTLFKRETIGRFSGYFRKIITSICQDVRQKIGGIEIISEAEKEHIIFKLNDTKVEYTRDKTIHELFEECVGRTPGNIALKYHDDTLSYREVNEKANQLARVLRNKGVGPDNLVGIMVERSFEMIVGIFAIIKAGGAYLPVDPNYPEDRVRYLFEDSCSGLLLTQEKHIAFAGSVDFDGEVLNLDDHALYKGENTNIENVNKPEDMAYIIYTSGSTGKPKGVVIEHVAAVNLLLTLDRMYPIEASDAYLLKTAFLFDVSVSEIFGWFWRGGRLVVLQQGGEKDPLMMIDRIKEDEITHLNFVPSLFNVFVSMLDEDNVKKLAGLRYIFLAGEAIWPESVLKFRSFGTDVIIENLYGPTEATVYASWYPVAKWKGTGSVSIGKPVDNLKLYILSSDNKASPALQPVGIAGELTISGIQLARGYLNRPDLTTKMFVDSPFAEAEEGDKNFSKLYHTGDLTRWSPDGTIEYMGRIDFQVKVRGYRIELGEIESQLTALDEVNESIVIVRQDQEGEKYLCAYLMSDESIDMTSVRKRLSDNIPNYMVPSYFVQIDKIPLNPNGKLDRKALPEPEAEAFTTEYAKPETKMEKILAEVWAEALGTKQVGVDDNFFEIGGDSIKTIMITAKLKKRQLKVNINDFFSYKTIRKLAMHVKVVERKIDQGTVSGEVELTPIHKWFFRKDSKGIHYFNQVVMQRRKEGLDGNFVRKVFEKIVQHHDALRMVYERDGDMIVQRNRGLGEGQLIHMEVVEFKDKDHFDNDSEGIIDRVNDGIDLNTGPLVRLGLFKLPGEDIFMIGIHHNVMDGVSWRILLEDFETGYRQVENGEPIKFPDKTDSVKEWALQLKEYADSSRALEEIDYWNTIEKMEIEKLPMGRGAGKETMKYKNQEVVSMNLDKEKSLQLVKEANWVYNTEINDLFLTILGMSIKEWSGNTQVLFNLEGHGREGIIEDIDISRTIGWFTSQYPVVLDMSLPGCPDSPEEEMVYQIRNVKETLRRIPNKGIGHAILKYMTSPEKKGDISFNLQPEICFNYLGQLEEETDQPGETQQLNLVLRASGECDTSYPIDIYGGVGKDGLNLLFNYDKYEFERSDIERLADCFRANLIKVTDHCVTMKKQILSQRLKAVDYHVSKDYDRYLGQVNSEEWPRLSDKNGYRHILLTGGTGFLGAHLVAELLNGTDAILYLPIRGASQGNAEERFKEKMTFYFGGGFYHTHKERLTVIRSDLSEHQLGMEESRYKELVELVDSVVHSAANVKHVGAYEDLYKDNVMATEGLLKLAAVRKKADFHYVSTISVGEGNIPGREYILYTEYCNDIGMEIDQIYLKSKFEAELKVLEYREKGVNGSIYRVGNLIFHSETGKFQENIGNDYFYSIIKAAIKLEMLSDRMKEKMVFDMSFINYTARSLVLLATCEGLQNQTYHLINPNPLPMTEMANYLRELGYKLNDVKDESEYFKKFEGDSEQENLIELMNHHSWVFDEKEGTVPIYKLDRTVMLLEKLGLEWPKTTKELVEKMIAYCKEVNFF